MAVPSVLQRAASDRLEAPCHATVDRAPGQRWSRRVAADVVGLADVAAVILGALVPAFLCQQGDTVAPLPTIIQNALITAVIVHGCLRNWCMYDTTAMHDFPVQPGRLFGALALALTAVLGLAVPFAAGQAQSWAWHIVWLAAAFALLIANRIAAHYVLARCTAAGRFDTRVAIFGAGRIARHVHDHVVNAARGVRLAGVYDDRQDDQRLDADGLPIAGRLDDLIAAGLDGKLDQIVIALPAAADRRVADVARRLEQLPVSLHVVTHLASDLVDQGPAHQVSRLGPVGLLDVKHKPLADWGPFLKRVEDTVCGGGALLLALPLFLVIALAVKLDSNGPVFFRQRRRGLNQRIIEVLKFRTMTVLEDGAEVRQVTQNDPRVTRVGRFLRRTSLDELPQLINVLKGEMSLVGPRPHALVHDEQWGELLERYANRHQVKPGITGLAQIKGWRGEAATPRSVTGRIEQDLAYIQDWSLWLDLKILGQTLCAVIGAKNAH